MSARVLAKESDIAPGASFLTAEPESREATRPSGEEIAFVRYLKLGCVSTHCEPAVFEEEILQTQPLFLPVS